MGLFDRVVEAQGVGDLLIGRVAEHDLTASDDHRNVGGSDVEMIEQLLDAGLAVQVEQRVGMPVSGEELADPERPLAMRRPQDHDVADAAGDQFHPAQDEGAHEEFAQLAVGLDQREQVIATHFDDLTGHPGPDLGEPAAARQDGHFPREHPRAERDHDLLGGRRADDVDPPGRDHEESHRALPRLHQHLARLDMAQSPVRGDARELRRRQHRIEVLGPRTCPRRGSGGEGHRGKVVV